ncbi:tetratricopeptide repeat protein [Bacteriovorax sp. Seq25_V]|uniref:tetratricopeptide repeat protein n=1 Tax=Bacteriovorax sp. Seq25_V TaxID=1201288 RepID=UPI00038A0D20|nr:tetratricopeptide repeat protein [Bacteriovorax sp. Seq25_V]EQC43286.1 tetratricopeptide repeat protein [Bacteriovorax sp. Seq25_V]
MKKYRVKNDDGRIIGPLLLTDLVQLQEQNEISATSLFQVFPLGDWDNISNFQEIKKAFSEKKEEDSTRTITEQVEQPSRPAEDATEFREFKFDRRVNNLVDYGELERRHKVEKEKIREAEEKKEVELEKTRIVKLPDVESVEKTRIVRRDDLVMDDNEGAADEPEKSDAPVVGKKEVVQPPEEKIDVNEKTMMVSLNDLMPAVPKKDDYRDLEKELLVIEKQEKIKTRSAKQGAKKAKKTTVEPIKNKKNLSIILFVIVSLIFLLPDSNEKEETVFRPKIQFPIVAKIENTQLAKQDFEKGLKLYQKDNYKDIVAASLLFNKSLVNKFRGNEALPYLIISYSELLPAAQNQIEYGKVLNQLITIAGPAVLSDSNVALGAANYFANFNKKHTAVTILERYLRLNRPTPKVYAKYLSLLIDIGDFVKSKSAFEKLEKAPKSDVDVIEAMGKYLILNEQPEKALELYKQSHEKFKDNLRFLAIYGNVLLKLRDIETLKPLTVILLAKKGGGSPIIYAQALKFMGYIQIAQNKFKEVPKYFKASLELYDSRELKEVLATLDVGGDKIGEEIITKSKIDLLITKSKREVSLLNWEKAFQYAIQASDLSESNLDAKLYLAELQSRRGYYNSAISTLSKLREYYPLNIDVNYELLMANLRAYRVGEVKRLIQSFSTIKTFQDSFEYLAVLGHYYNLIGNDKLAFDRYQGALQKNPLRDDIYFEMAKIAFSLKKFARCKEFLGEAMKLDPFNYDYKILYSRVIFEMDDVTTAIGYLRNELEKSVDNPKLVGQIAIFYFRDQNFAEYKLYREKLERLSKSDESLYEYLVESAELEKDFKAIVENAEKLLLVAPGKIDIRMKLASAYTELGKYSDAIRILNSVEERLSAYPRVNYYKANIFLKQNDLKSAEEAAKKEIEVNSGSHLGYYILGKIYMQAKDYTEAKKSLEKSIQIKPDFYECLLELGELKEKQGHFAAARELYLRALRQNDLDPELHKRLGFIYKEIGQGQMAIEQFKTYLNLNPAAQDRAKINRIILQLQ